MPVVLYLCFSGIFGLAMGIGMAWWREWRSDRALYREHERIRRAYHDSEWEAAEFERLDEEPPASAPKKHPGIGEFVSVPYDVWRRYNHTM